MTKTQRQKVVKDLRAAAEKWKRIPDTNGMYRVSTNGRIMSLYFGKHRILKPWKDKWGYSHIKLWVDKKKKNQVVSRLVLIAFKGWPKSGQTDCAHVDGNPLNNHLSNLVWATRTENMHHAKTHGTIQVGEKNHRAKLTTEIVTEIIALRSSGLFQREVAKKFNVSTSTVSRIWLKEAWVHVCN